MRDEAVQARFQAAVESFIEKIKTDKNVIALILQGSLSYDSVWEKSDIDSLLVVREQPLTQKSFCLNEDDIPFNVDLVERSGLRRYFEKALGGSIAHSFITTAKVVYTTDDSLFEYLEDLKIVGKDDMARSLMFIATDVAYVIEKCTKWLTVKDNPRYCQYWLLKGAEDIARMIICLSYETPNREAVLRASEINPELMKKFYETPMTGEMSVPDLERALKEMDEYLEGYLDIFGQPIMDYLSDGEIKTVSQIAGHFGTSPHGVFHTLDYMCDKGLIEKVSKTISITPKSRKLAEEMAFMRIML